MTENRISIAGIYEYFSITFVSDFITSLYSKKQP